MLGSAKVMNFVATADAVAAQNFYCGVLGLQLVADSPFALVLNAGGTTLRVQKVDTVITPRYTSLGWEVDDMTKAVDELTAAGVEFLRVDGLPQDDLGIWTTSDGSAVAWFKDPDGNTLSLTQLAS